MIKDCNKECPTVCVLSGYRSYEYQANNFNNKVKDYQSKGYSKEEAEKEAATIIARPGTSEHQLGLAVDIIDTQLWALEEEQADLPAQKWLMEHCWEYGFILRYPRDKQDITGITYEPWHYRYVGMEAAEEITSRGICLEEYLGVIDAEEPQEDMQEESQED
jgi:D-alanyl-D-alanine carboxypeptidase